MEQMIGNAVPVKLAEYVALKLKQYIISQEVIEENKESFIKWLVEVKKFTPRSASDTLSRIRRADKICHLNGAPTDYYCFLLQKEEAYIELSVSVRSQMKRALTLYNSFILQNSTKA